MEVDRNLVGAAVGTLSTLRTVPMSVLDVYKREIVSKQHRIAEINRTEKLLNAKSIVNYYESTLEIPDHLLPVFEEVDGSNSAIWMAAYNARKILETEITELQEKLAEIEGGPVSSSPVPVPASPEEAW